MEFDEYELLMEVLSNGYQDTFEDTLRNSYNGTSPITYGDVYLDENGEE